MGVWVPLPEERGAARCNSAGCFRVEVSKELQATVGVRHRQVAVGRDVQHRDDGVGARLCLVYILRPSRRIVDDVVTSVTQVVIVANNVFIVVSLPQSPGAGKPSPLSGPTAVARRGERFEAVYDIRQG